MELLDISNANEIYTVSRLVREVRLTLEGTFPFLWIEGEISNFVAHSSGHWYFCIKDPIAQVRCVMFRLQNRRLDFIPTEGMRILIKARVSLYEGRGEFQLLIEHMEEAGIGKLRQAFEALKKRLYEEGLFNEVHKKKLPYLPKTIGVITSPTGAAIRDILSVLLRRFACANIIIYPTSVQGEAAPAGIISAIQTANQRNECDVLILARGGGSLEDLWSFNEEKVAVAIFQSKIPLISGVGHEIDFTIADFVADVRAPTPSAAAELVVPHTTDLSNHLTQQQKQLLHLLQKKLHHFQQTLVWVTKHLQQQHPKRSLDEQAQRLDTAETTLLRLQNKLLSLYQARLHTLTAQLLGLTPAHRIADKTNQLKHFRKILYAIAGQSLHHQQQSLENLSSRLDALSPLATLKRGYAIATYQQQIIKNTNEISIGKTIEVRVIDGILNCLVKEIE